MAGTNFDYLTLSGGPVYGPASMDMRGARGMTYFVDGNYGSDGNDGLSWDSPYKTLAKALAISHANIALNSRGWASRNTIYAVGDSFEESLTKLAQKTDVVAVGSCDHLYGARLIGAHVIDATSYMGCRFWNWNFKGTASACDIFTLTTSQSGIGFFYNNFDGNTTAAAHGAIIATAVESLQIVGNVFRGPFDDAVIELGAGESNSLLIANNLIHGANMGIDVSASLTTSVRAGWIINNVIKSTLACINDASSKLHIVGNKGITLANKGSSLAGAVVGNTHLASDNRFTCGDADNVDWPALGSI